MVRSVIRSNPEGLTQGGDVAGWAGDVALTPLKSLKAAGQDL